MSNADRLREDLHQIGFSPQEMLAHLLLPEKWDEEYARNAEVHAAFDMFLAMLPGMVDGVLTQAKESSRLTDETIRRFGTQGYSHLIRDPQGLDDDTVKEFRLDGQVEGTTVLNMERFFGMDISAAAARARDHREGP